jgi:hypothetical protein
MATASVLWTVPLTLPGGKPVIEALGQRPKSPLITLGPVLVTVQAPRTPKLLAVLRMLA